MSDRNRVSRRDFLSFSLGAMGAGMAIFSGSRFLNSFSERKLKKVAAGDLWPYPVEGLDIEGVRQYGKDAYYIAGCGYASSFALVQALKDNLGAGTVWDTLPLDMFRYGTGGAIGWGTLCGALNGSLAIITLVCPNWQALGEELMGWYTLTPLPTDTWNPETQTIADSPLCHLSVSRWAKAAGCTIDSKEKADRCSSVAGDTAARAAQLLNEYAAQGSIIPTYKVPEEYARCLDCHNTRKDQVGKMNCLLCHEEPPQPRS